MADRAAANRSIRHPRPITGCPVALSPGGMSAHARRISRFDDAGACMKPASPVWDLCAPCRPVSPCSLHAMGISGDQWVCLGSLWETAGKEDHRSGGTEENGTYFGDGGIKCTTSGATGSVQSFPPDPVEVHRILPATAYAGLISTQHNWKTPNHQQVIGLYGAGSRKSRRVDGQAIPPATRRRASCA
jgi:hypothetical protein